MGLRRRVRVRGAVCAGAAAIVAAAISTGLLVGPKADLARAAEPVAITQAPALEWGFKESWRSYVGVPTFSRGAARVDESSSASYDVTWNLKGGSYDADARSTELRYEGTVRWQKYQGYGDLPDDVYALDLELSDPIVTTSRDRSTLSVLARDRAGGQDVDYGRIVVVDLNLDGIAPTVSGGTTSWSAIPTAFNDEATAAFGGGAYYRPGQAADPVSFSYSGPGGAPDFSDVFAAPGTQRLALDGPSVRITPPETANGVYEYYTVDQANRLVYYSTQETVDGEQRRTYSAFDMSTGAKLEGSLTLPSFGDASLGFPRLVDPQSGRVFVARNDEPVARWFRYERGVGMVQGVIAQPVPLAPSQRKLGWDTENRRAFEVVRTVPDGVAANAYDQHRWKLRTYTPTDSVGDAWQLREYDLPNAEIPRHNRFLYLQKSAAASDGSLIVLGDRRSRMSSSDPAVPATVPGAFRVVTNDDGTATTTPIAGTTRPNQVLQQFDVAAPGPDGLVALVRTEGGQVQRVDVTPESGPIQAEPLVETGFAAAEVYEEGVTVDPEDGTVWLGGQKTQRLVGISGGRIVADQQFPNRSTKVRGLFAGPGHTLWMQSTELNENGDANLDTLFTHPTGFQKLKRVGVAATVTTDPADRSVSLGVGEESEDVSFTAAASGGEPDPALQWQVKTPGAARFKDIGGQTGATLSVSAEPGMDGAEYRAVFFNPGGRVATDPAVLSVAYAPRVGADVLDQSVAPGQDATFDVLTDGNPAPAITWQRRVNGFWQTIAGDDENFSIEPGKLVVKDTNIDQSGALVRARLTNAVGTAYSRSAKLTVKAPEPRALTGVRLNWTGSAELQRRMPNNTASFFSAGVSDGKQGTYAAASRSVRILQVGAGGAEAPATWSTREAHLTSGGRQVVRLVNGSGQVAADGSATVSWTGSFSVNTYGGLVPFTVTDPTLSVDPQGAGTLKATLSGYASSFANPNERTPIPPVADVTIATFDGARIDPDGTTSTITPDYAGVEVDVPAGQTPQNRTTQGWGAWPQPFVDFHFQTGLGSYWYSSGGAADPFKAGQPFTVSVTGQTDPDPSTPLATPPATLEALPTSPRPTTPSVIRKRSPVLSAARATRTVSRRSRTVTVATIRCPIGPCRIGVRRTPRLRIGGRRYTALVTGPSTVRAGRTATLRARLSKAALARLKRRRAVLAVPVTVRSPAGTTRRTFRITVR